MTCHTLTRSLTISRSKEVIMETKSMSTHIHGVTLALDNNHKVKHVLNKGKCKIGAKKSLEGFQFFCCKNHLRFSTWPNGKKIKSKWNNLLLPWQGGMKVAMGCTWPRKYIDHYWKKDMWMKMGKFQCKNPLLTSLNICNIQRHMWLSKSTL